MIEVKARMTRSAVYLAGETVHCEITFTNINENDCVSPSKANHHKEQKLADNVAQVERLAWSSVQIHCQCSAASGRVVVPGKTNVENNDILSPIDKSTTSFAPARG